MSFSTYHVAILPLTKDKMLGYTVEQSNADSITDYLNKMAADGWTLIAVTPVSYPQEFAPIRAAYHYFAR